MVRARLTSKGQLTLPVAIRRQYGLNPGDEVEFIAEEKGTYLVPVKRRKLMDLYGILKTDKPWPGMARAREMYAKKIADDYVRKHKPR